MATVTNDVLSVRIPSTLIKSLDKLAIMMDRSKSYVAEQALIDFVDDRTWLLNEAAKGQRDIDVGSTVSWDNAKKTFVTIRKGVKGVKK